MILVVVALISSVSNHILEIDIMSTVASSSIICSSTNSIRRNSSPVILFYYYSRSSSRDAVVVGGGSVEVEQITTKLNLVYFYLFLVIFPTLICYYTGTE